MFRIDVLTTTEDGRAATLEKEIPAKIRVLDVYTANSPAATDPVYVGSLANPVTQKAFSLPAQFDDYVAALGAFDWAVEVGFLPGVTDNVGHTASEILSLIEGQHSAVYSSRLYILKGTLSRAQVESFAAGLHNPLIQRATIKDYRAFANDNGMGIVIPAVHLTPRNRLADEVDLAVSDDELLAIGTAGIADADGSRRGPLGLSLLYMKAIQAYFAREGRKATDIELETLAQTWSEHCKHTIFAAPLDDDLPQGLYKSFIKSATNTIRRQKGADDFCVSVFSDNAGGIIFDDEWVVADKVETHNSPSALDPFGGAITGIVGVNRDCIGFGQGAKPVINRYGFCFADPRTQPEFYRGKGRTNRMLSPETVMKGVIAGVNHGGNCSGIPTPQGFLYFDDRYAGKPLVFAGTVGLIPREINGRPGHEKLARAGDRIVVAGGKVGRDGIHGATFSSVALDEGSPATAVQIGDPITQKKLSDAVIKEIRDLGLYTAITDNGAGGLSSSIGEMGRDSGGFHVELDKVPLKYPGMEPWEIWISESQERMSFAVPAENVGTFIALLARRGVEAWDIGSFTDTGRAVVSWQGEILMDLSMDFLHDGLPEKKLKTTFVKGGEPEPDLTEPDDYNAALTAMLSRLNICSREFVVTQYDHEVQAGTVLKPLQGPGRVCAEATITKPVLVSPRGVVLSQGLAPRYSDIDTGAMAAVSLDMAVRAAVAAGAHVDHLALLDNICWCSAEDPDRLGQLKRAIGVIHDLAIIYGTPFISGKDSMFNDFKGYDRDDNPVKISAPPTLLVSSIGVIHDTALCVSLDPKQPGDLVYILGETRNELGASEYYAERGVLGQNVPVVDGVRNLHLYQLYDAARRKGLIASAMPVHFGGLGVALAKMAVAGQCGMDIDLSPLPDLRLDTLLFSESAGRMVVTVAPQDKQAFESHFHDFGFVHRVGTIERSGTLKINNAVHLDVKRMDQAYKAPLSGY